MQHLGIFHQDGGWTDKTEVLIASVIYRPNKNGGYYLKNGKKDLTDFLLLKEPMLPT